MRRTLTVAYFVAASMIGWAMHDNGSAMEQQAATQATSAPTVAYVSDGAIHDNADAIDAAATGILVSYGGPGLIAFCTGDNGALDSVSAAAITAKRAELNPAGLATICDASSYSSTATAAVTEAPSCVQLAGQIVMTHDYAGTTAQHLCFGEEDSTTVDMLLTISSHGAASLGYGSWSEADKALGYAVTIDLGWCTQATIDQDLCS